MGCRGQAAYKKTVSYTHIITNMHDTFKAFHAREQAYIQLYGLHSLVSASSQFIARLTCMYFIARLLLQVDRFADASGLSEQLLSDYLILLPLNCNNLCSRQGPTPAALTQDLTPSHRTHGANQPINISVPRTHAADFR